MAPGFHLTEHGRRITASPLVTQPPSRGDWAIFIGKSQLEMEMIVRRGARLVSGTGIRRAGALEAMTAQGLKTGPYNLPDWENTLDEFYRMIDRLIGER
jgi:hypothetical protein